VSVLSRQHSSFVPDFIDSVNTSWTGIDQASFLFSMPLIDLSGCEGRRV
jgi:hypothetical protein